MRELSSDYKAIGLRILNVALIVSLIMYSVYLLMRYVFPLVVVISVSALLQRPILMIKRRLRVNSAIASLISLLIGFIILFIVFGFGIIYLIDAFDSIIIQFPIYFQTIIDALKTLISTLINETLPHIEQFLSQFNFNLTDYLIDIVDRIYHFILTAAQNIVNQMIPIMSNLIIQVIGLTSTTLIVLILIVLLSKDWQKYQQVGARFIPKHVKEKLLDIYQHFTRISIGYLKVELIISGVTSLILIVGFYLLNIENGVSLGLTFGLVDLIPIIGVGLLLWPWILYTLLTGSYTLTIGLSIIYIVIVCLRQFLEPKLISKQIGMNAFFIICLGYLCFLFFGMVGVLFTPIVLVSIQTMKESQMDQIMLDYIRYGKDAG